MKRTVAVVAALGLLAPACTSAEEPIRIGAVYPLSGTQGEGGVEEFRGVRLAVDLVNEDGGVNGRPVELVPVDVASGDGAPAAIEGLRADGVELVLGSYGSTISAPAARAAAARDMLFWETGAVGEMTGEGAGELVFRFAPTGAVLGRHAVAFVSERLAPMLDRDPTELRWAVAMVDDAYGRAVAAGALDEIETRGLSLAGAFPYDPRTGGIRDLVRRLAAADPDVLFVASYLEDAVQMRREVVRAGLDLVTAIGTSSSYCMPAFGERLGADAVGLFASDKPDWSSLQTRGLTPEGAALYDRAEEAYDARWHADMSAAALAGFSGAWALLHEVLPAATSTGPAGVAAAATAVTLHPGSLPNGSGLAFGEPGTADAGQNLEAASVIWEWVAPGERQIVWPPQFATSPILPLDPAP